MTKLGTINIKLDVELDDKDSLRDVLHQKGFVVSPHLGTLISDLKNRGVDVLSTTFGEGKP
jgi:hypothetical protein